jgi:hypothetical protein
MIACVCVCVCVGGGVGSLSYTPAGVVCVCSLSPEQDLPRAVAPHPCVLGAHLTVLCVRARLACLSCLQHAGR